MVPWVVLLLAACVEEPPASTDVDSATPDAADTGDTAAPPRPTPAHDADAVVAALQGALAYGLPTFVPVADTFAEALTHAGTHCPGGAPNAFEVYDPAGCTTEGGWNFAGVGGYERDVADDGAWTYAVKADLVIRDETGAAFSVGGWASASWDDGAYAQEMFGSFQDEGADGWIGAGISAGFWLTGTAGGDVRLVALGGYTIDGVTVYCDELALGGAEAPTGSLSWREDGGWYRFALDGDVAGCGTITFDGSAIGEGCVALDGLAEAAAAEVVAWSGS